MVLDLNRKELFHIQVEDMVTMLFFGADMRSSAHANNKTKSILVLGKDFIQGIDNTSIYPEKNVFV